MQDFSLVSPLFVLSGLASAAVVAADLWHRPQQMRIMNAVWILTPLWSGILGLAAYFLFGRSGKPRSGQAGAEPKEGGMAGMETNGPATKGEGMAGMTNGPAAKGEDMEGMETNSPAAKDSRMAAEAMSGMGMDAPRPRWQSAVLSTLHCGAGCTLADLAGEWLLFFVPVAVGGSLLAGTWITDYLLALGIGIGFQYAAIREMGGITRGEAVIRAAKADFLSLTAWQAGMYGWMAVALFVLGNGDSISRTDFRFWFMMQIAMVCGFLVSLPVNVWLIRKGIKKGM